MQEPINNQSMLKVGTVLRGIYRIDSYLSSGGFGNTYVATNIEFDERVAVKEFFMKGVTQRDSNQTTISVSNIENQESFTQQREKFKKEARRLRQLNNPHIVRVHDLFEENGTAYYVMDYVDGESLAERLKRTGKPMTEKEVNLILPQILDALKSVHDAGIWHLDLKPANILQDKNGQVKLIDFGASKQLNAQKGGATTSTAISYTNGYAPREQMEQNYDKFGPWTDLYALGATLYNLLTNKRPPLPTNIDDDISADKHVALPMSNVSDEMKQLVLWMMNTNRMQRPQDINTILEKRVNSQIVETPDEETIIGGTGNVSSIDEETIIASLNPEITVNTESGLSSSSTTTPHKDSGFGQIKTFFLGAIVAAVFIVFSIEMLPLLGIRGTVLYFIWVFIIVVVAIVVVSRLCKFKIGNIVITTIAMPIVSGILSFIFLFIIDNLPIYLKQNNSRYVEEIYSDSIEADSTVVTDDYGDYEVVDSVY